MGESRNEPQDQGPRWKLLWFDEAGAAPLPDYEPPPELSPPFVRWTRKLKTLAACLAALLALWCVRGEVVAHQALERVERLESALTLAEEDRDRLRAALRSLGWSPAPESRPPGR